MMDLVLKNSLYFKVYSATRSRKLIRLSTSSSVWWCPVEKRWFFRWEMANLYWKWWFQTGLNGHITKILGLAKNTLILFASDNGPSIRWGVRLHHEFWILNFVENNVRCLYWNCWIVAARCGVCRPVQRPGSDARRYVANEWCFSNIKTFTFLTKTHAMDARRCNFALKNDACCSKKWWILY